MVICKYFLEGRCRYGDRCFNEHFVDNRYKYQNELYDKVKFPKNKPWEEQSYYKESDYNNQYESNYRHKSDSYNRDQYTWHAPSPTYEYHPSCYDASSGFNKAQAQNYNSRPSFSFNLSKNKFDALKEPTFTQKSSSIQDDVDLRDIKKDMVAWEKGNCWPFSCYSPCKGLQSIPDFKDTSPEELRYSAYEAKKNNDFSTYTLFVAEAMNDVELKRNLLKNPTHETIQRIKNLKSESMLQDEIKKVPFNTNFSSGASSFSFKNATVGASGFGLGRLMETPSLSLASKDSSSYGINDAPMDDSSSSFQFSLTPKKIDFSFKSTSTEPKVPEKSSTLLYTCLSELNEEEKRAFSESVFTLGKIPIRPPPKEMCY